MTRERIRAISAAARRRPRIIAAVLSLLVWLFALQVSAPARAQDHVQGEALRQLISGNTFKGGFRARQLTMVFYHDGTVRGSLGLTGSDNGTWRIEGDSYCHEWFTYFAGVPRCYRWRKTGRGYLLENVDSFRTRSISGRMQPGMPPGY